MPDAPIDHYLRIVSRETIGQDVPTVERMRDSPAVICTDGGNVIVVASLMPTVALIVVDLPPLPRWRHSADADFVSVRHVLSERRETDPDTTDNRTRLASMSLRDVTRPANPDVKIGLRTPNGVDAFLSIDRQPDIPKLAGDT